MGLIYLEPLLTQKNRHGGQTPLSPKHIRRAQLRKNSGYLRALQADQTYLGDGCRVNGDHRRNDDRSRRFEHTRECLLCVASKRPEIHADIMQTIERGNYSNLRSGTARSAIRKRLREKRA